MDGQMPPKRKRKSRRIRKLPFIILSILIFLLVIFFYIKSSYSNGLDVAKKHAQQQVPYVFNGVDNKDGKINVLILGQDRMVDGSARTDSIMIGQYDYIQKKMKIISVMRDIYAEIPGYRNYKINTAYTLGGPELLRKTIKQNLGIDIEHYAIIDFKGFAAMVDEISPDGVPIDVEKDMSEKIGVTLQKGKHNLNGKELLGYARYRNDAEADFGRVRRQQQVIRALKEEMVSLPVILKTPKLAGIARGYVNTDMTDGEIFRTGTSFVLRGSKDPDTLVVPVDNSYTQTNYPEAGAVLEIDKEKNKAAIKKFLES
ncbi:LCP family protein [Macrococcoides caseolyticum]|uniref:LCP family protein n=1 Tax=Macrococcoides caseolyticum TaxID=69966 RepID=UPI001F4569CB|nr:LCP family protein [Macrococcus caseolyticus]MCE4957137.1 LCP family protein [Macrococcus caseolyticus]